MGKKKRLGESGSRNSRCSSKNSRCSSRNSRCSSDFSPRSIGDEDDVMFVELSQEFEEEGTKLFQRREYEAAAFKFDKAIKLLPRAHVDVAHLHSNIAACYMHMIPKEYHRAIDECNLALEASPRYTKALLKRARCFQALDRLDLASRDIQKVLSLEPNNLTALEISERLWEEMDEVTALLEEAQTIVAKPKIKRKISRKFRNSIVEEEVWEEIPDEEKQCIDEEDNEEHIDKKQGNDDDNNEVKYAKEKHVKNGEQEDEKLNKEKQVRNGHDIEEKHTEEMQVKNDQDMEEKHFQEMQVEHGQNREEVSDEEEQMNYGKWNNEAICHEQNQGKHDENQQEKQSEEKQVKHGEQKQEINIEQKQVNGMEKHQKHIEVMHISGHRKHKKHKKHTDKQHGKDTNGKQREHATKKQIGYCEDKKDVHADVELANHRMDKNRKNTEESNTTINKGAMKAVKFVFKEDIRCAQIHANCSWLQLREMARNKFPCLKAMFIKYKDREGDLVTITSSEELRWAKELADPQGPMKFYVTEVDPEREHSVDAVRPSPSFAMLERNHNSMSENGSTRHEDDKNSYDDDWMMQFAQLFKNHVGFDSDAYLDLHDIGMRLYYEAMEDTVTSEEAQEIFQAAEVKFQEMAALALFNWGNIHMSCARKRLSLSEDASMEAILTQVKGAYKWACAEYAKAGKKYEEAVDIKPDFYEGLIALGLQQFEQAKLSWCYALGCKVDMGTEVLELFNHAEDNMEKGMEMWEGMEYLRLKGVAKPKKERVLLEKMGLEGYTKDLLPDEAFEQASNVRSQLNILWGTILYERSVVEFKLRLPSWEETLTEAIEKFKIGGASLADISVMIKNHSANESTQEGFSFKIDEIVQAWNEMYDAKKWRSGSISFRLEPLFRRRPSKLHHILEYIRST